MSDKKPLSKEREAEIDSMILSSAPTDDVVAMQAVLDLRSALDHARAPSAPARDEICEQCGGKGKVTPIQYMVMGSPPAPDYMNVTCPACRGTGRKCEPAQELVEACAREAAETWCADGSCGVYELAQVIAEGFAPVLAAMAQRDAEIAAANARVAEAEERAAVNLRQLKLEADAGNSHLTRAHEAERRVKELEAIIKQHDLCHNLHGKVDDRAFADGCAAEQRKLYGRAPDADRIAALESQLRAQPERGEAEQARCWRAFEKLLAHPMRIGQLVFETQNDATGKTICASIVANDATGKSTYPMYTLAVNSNLPGAVISAAVHQFGKSWDDKDAAVPGWDATHE